MWINQFQMKQNVVERWQMEEVADAIISLFNAMNLQLKYAIVLYESLLVLFLCMVIGQ